jgi:hypothetical protein
MYACLHVISAEKSLYWHWKPATGHFRKQTEKLNNWLADKLLIKIRMIKNNQLVNLFYE